MVYLRAQLIHLNCKTFIFFLFSASLLTTQVVILCSLVALSKCRVQKAKLKPSMFWKVHQCYLWHIFALFRRTGEESGGILPSVRNNFLFLAMNEVVFSGDTLTFFLFLFLLSLFLSHHLFLWFISNPQTLIRQKRDLPSAFTQLLFFSSVFPSYL